jgi:LytS/YehU family sensor histidine kinase
MVMSFIRFLLNPWIKDMLGAFHRGNGPGLGRLFFYASFWTIMFSIYSVVIYLSIEWFRERKSRYLLLREKQQSEIDLLKSQVNPHFLMNTLNNLYSLVYQGSKHAEDAILKLSDLLRYMLYDTQAEYVSLENEIKYLNSLIELQLLRFSHKDFIDFQIQGDPTGKLIAPMLLVPFIENAFKHGNKNTQGLGIKILMVIENQQLSFHVSNLKVSSSADKIEESGIGLSNIKKRLELQYPGRHQLSILDGPELFDVSLIIDL